MLIGSNRMMDTQRSIGIYFKRSLNWMMKSLSWGDELHDDGGHQKLPVRYGIELKSSR